MNTKKLKITGTAEGLIRLYEELNDPTFVICYDVGHANRMGINPAEMVLQLGSRIKCTHVHDNMGNSDSHFLPFQGNIDWESVMQAFADIDYQGDFSYEAGTFVKRVPVEMRALSAKSLASTGVRCAEYTCTSKGISKEFNISVAFFIMGRSLSLPIMIPTFFIKISLKK